MGRLSKREKKKKKKERREGGGGGRVFQRFRSHIILKHTPAMR